MRKLLALLLLLLAVPSWAAQQTRAPRVLLIVQQSRKDLVQFVRPALAAYGCAVYPWILSSGETLGRPANVIGKRAYQPNGWGIGQNFAFDGVVIMNGDWKFVSDARWDSLTFAPTYPDVPILAINSNGGLVTSTPDSTGVTTGTSNVVPTATACSLVGTNFQVGQSTGNGEQACIVSASYPNGGVTKLIENPSGGDTTTAWVRNLGNGTKITFVQVIAAGGDAPYKGCVPNILLGISEFISQMPDTVRPNPVFKFAYHIDDGFKRGDNTTGGAIQPAQYATMSGYVDSLVTRGIKYTIGVELDTDTLSHVASGAAGDAEDTGALAGDTRWNKDLLAWNSPFCKFTPHCHGGVDPGTSGNATTTGAFYDLCGGSRNRVTDPTAAIDTTLYWMNKLALDSLSARVGSNRVDHTVMPPTDDWAPLNLFTSPSTVPDMMASYKRAGYRNLRFNPSPVNLPGASTNSDAGGYYSWGGNYPTAYGPLGLIAVNFDGYLPGLSASSQTALTTAQRASYVSDSFSGLIIGRLGGGQIGQGQAGAAIGYSPILVNHARNYGGAAPGWMVARDIDSWFQALNRAAGYQQYQWAWSEDLNAQPWWNL